MKLKKFFISYRCLKSQKHSVRRGLSYCGFTFYEHIINNLLKQLFIFKTLRCVWIKRFYTSIFFFGLLETVSPLKTFYMAFHSTKQKTWKRGRLSSTLKLLRFFWMLMNMSLPKFDIYQGTGDANCFKSHTNSWCPHFFQENVLPDVPSEIHLT